MGTSRDSFVAQHEVITVPSGNVSPRYAVGCWYLCHVHHEPGRSVEPSSGPLYYLALRRWFRMMDGGVHEEFYHRHLPTLVPALMEAVPVGLDALACVPSSSPDILAPYRDHYIARSPTTEDISMVFARLPGMGSTEGASPSERLEGMAVNGSLPSISTLLLIDDALASGITVASVIHAVARVSSVLPTITLACPIRLTRAASTGPARTPIVLPE